MTAALWEQNYTALSVFLDSNHVIVSKAHTDNQPSITASVQNALARE